MLILFSCILLNSLISVIFKLFEKFNVDNLQAIVINYLTCVLTAFVVSYQNPFPSNLFLQPWIGFAIGLGMLFIFVFNLFAITVQKSGVMVSTIFQKMSLVAPALIPILYYNEPSGIIKWAGIIVSMMAIVLLSYNPANQNKSQLTKKIWIYPLLTLDKVPQRAPNMSSYEIMLSESQERMLIVVHKGREEEVKRIFDKWDLPWAEIGIITDTGHMKVRHGGKLVVDMPARKIAEEWPVYQREAVEPAYLKDVRAFRLDGISDTQNPTDDLKKLLAWPSIASKNWVYRQYDHQVRDGSVVLPGSDAAVIRIKTDSLPVMSAELPAKLGDAKVSEKLIAMTVDCNGGYLYLDPYEGANRPSRFKAGAE